MEPKEPLAHETRLPHHPEPVDFPLLSRSAERYVLFNDGDFLVLAIPNGDEVDFRVVVRLDPDDTDNSPTPLSREEFLAKYPLDPRFIDPNAYPLTTANCQQLAANYHAHEKECLALSSGQRLMIIDPRPGGISLVTMEMLPGGKEQLTTIHIPTGSESEEEPVSGDLTAKDLMVRLDSDLDLIKEHTHAAKDTRLIPMVYLWKNGFCRVMVLQRDTIANPALTFDRRSQTATSMGRGPEPEHAADALALVLNATGAPLGQPSGSKIDAWVVHLRIRKGDRLWSCVQPYSLDAKKVTWGERETINSATDPCPEFRRAFQLPAWY